jgi:hypothetical protein
VNLAARISAVARGGEVLLRPDRIALHEHGRRQLGNIAEPVVLFAAAREGERSLAGLPIDPVCRMAVDPPNLQGTLPICKRLSRQLRGWR